MTADYNDLVKKLEEYKNKYRRQDLPPIKESGFYALFPEEESKYGEVESDDKHKWPKPWPFSDHEGCVYAIFGKERLLYIGQSVNPIGYRLSQHFSEKYHAVYSFPDSGWTEKPFFIKVFAIEKPWFEVLALEAFLIWELKPVDNGRGK